MTSLKKLSPQCSAHGTGTMNCGESLDCSVRCSLRITEHPSRLTAHTCCQPNGSMASSSHCAQFSAVLFKKRTDLVATCTTRGDAWALTSRTLTNCPPVFPEAASDVRVHGPWARTSSSRSGRKESTSVDTVLQRSSCSVAHPGAGKPGSGRPPRPIADAWPHPVAILSQRRLPATETEDMLHGPAGGWGRSGHT